MFTDLQPCLSGQAMAEQPALKSYMVILKQLISAPQDVYQALYLSTMYRFFEFGQALPLNKGDEQPYSLVKWHLERTITALKLRRGRMLPVNSDSETIASQEAWWTYALFTAGLLANHQWNNEHYTVELYKNANEFLGSWHCIVGSLYEPGAYYKIVPNYHPLQLDDQVSQAMIIGRILPIVGLRWLAGYPLLFPLWLDAVWHSPQSKPHNPLMQLLHEAEIAVGFPLITEGLPEKSQPHSPKETATAKSRTLDLQELLLDWLQLQSDKSTLEKDTVPVFLQTSEGLLITIAGLTAFLDQHFIHHSITEFVALFKDTLFKPQEGEQTGLPMQYRSSQVEKRQSIQGYLLNPTYLSDTLRSLPVEKRFIADIPL